MNFKTTRALLSTKENTSHGFGIWHAGTSLCEECCRAACSQKKYGVPGIPMARPRVYKVLNPVFCKLTCIQRAPINMIIRVDRIIGVPEISTAGPTILGLDNPSDYDKLRRVRIRNSRTKTTSL